MPTSPDRSLSAAPVAPAEPAAPTRGALAVLASAILFGVSSVVARAIFNEQSLPPLVLVQVRMCLAFLVMAAGVGLWRPDELRLPRAMRLPVVLWGALPLLLVQYTYFFAISETNVATAVFLQYTSPIFGALYARVIGRERLSPTVLGGLGLAMAGSTLLVLGGQGLVVAPVGIAAGIVSSGLMTWYTIWANRLTQRVSPWALLTWGMAGAALAGFVFTPPWRLAPYLGRAELWPFFIYLAVLAAAVPFSLYIYGLRSVGATPALILMTAEPVVGAMGAWAALGEKLAPIQVAGAVSIAAAVLLVQLVTARH